MHERAYHHGDLRNALIEAGVELGREGGPQAIVLREAARRVGVSPNAAYRHFADLDELVAQVARRAYGALAATMRSEVHRVRPTGDDRVDAWDAMRAVGRGYVHFALRQPGLFAVAFGRDGTGPKAAPDPDGSSSPQAMLTDALARMAEVGLLDARDLESARVLAWSAVHGLAVLLLGPMSGVPRRAREAVIDAMLEQVGAGILARPTRAQPRTSNHTVLP